MSDLSDRIEVLESNLADIEREFDVEIDEIKDRLEKLEEKVRVLESIV